MAVKPALLVSDSPDERSVVVWPPLVVVWLPVLVISDGADEVTVELWPVLLV